MYTQSQKNLILEKIKDALEESYEKEYFDSIPAWKNILFILEKYNSESFFGNVSIKISGTKMFPVKIQDQTFKDTDLFFDFEKSLDK